MRRMQNCRILGLSVLAIIVAGPALFAGKPAPAPKPPGKIIFITTHNGGPAYLEMDGDGSGKSQTGTGVSTEPPAIPSHKSYGHRWWLTSLLTPSSGLTDVYATDGTRFVQLTAAGQRNNDDGVTETIMRFSSGAIWSNNGLDILSDTYCGFWGVRTKRNKTTLERLENQRIFYRLNVSALELEGLGQGALDPVFDGIFDVAPRLVPVLSTPVQSPPGYAQTYGASFSPDGTQLAFIAYYDNTDDGPDIYVADLSNGPASTTNALKIYDNAGTFGARSVDWSRVNDPAQWRIAYVANGHVYTVRPDGTGLVDVVPSGVYPDFVSWSPDDKYLAFRLSTRKGLYYNYNIGRVPAAGGAVVNLTSDLGNTYDKGLVGWRP